MSDRSRNPYDEAGVNRAGYGNWLTPRYQTLGPSEDPSLDRLIMIVGSGEPEPFTTRNSPFEVLTPDVKARTRIVLAIEPFPGTDIDQDEDPITDLLNDQRLRLWLNLRTAVRPQVGGTPRIPPTRNLAGTGTTPIAWPTDVRLWGWEMEIETAGQNIRGAVGLDGLNSPVNGYFVHLIVRYNSVERLSDEEWKQFTSRAGIRRGAPVEFAGGE